MTAEKSVEMIKVMKFNKLVILSILIILSMAIVLTGCGNDTEKEEKNAEPVETVVVPEPEPEPELEPEPEPIPEPEPETEPEPEPEPEPIGPNSHLTGLPILQESYNRRPVGVMISNIKTALPQYGVSEAEIIYEVMVEGGITRFFALFQDFDTEKIGPIRSSRHYFLDLALEHDAVYTHVGQSVYAIEAFKTLDVDRFYGISYLDLIMSFQDEDRHAPHSTFTNFDHLMDAWETTGYEMEADYSEVKFTFSEEPILLEEGRDVASLKLNYSDMYPTDPEFRYNEEDELYYRYEFGEEHIDAGNGQQLKFKNVLVQYATTWWIKDDTNGCIDMTLITDGTGMYLTNGKMVPITWSKDNHYAPTKYFYEDGTELVLNPGKTFVSIYPRHKIEEIIME